MGPIPDDRGLLLHDRPVFSSTAGVHQVADGEDHPASEQALVFLAIGELHFALACVLCVVCVFVRVVRGRPSRCVAR